MKTRAHGKLAKQNPHGLKHLQTTRHTQQPADQTEVRTHLGTLENLF